MKIKHFFNGIMKKIRTDHKGDIFGGPLISLAKEHQLSIPAIKEAYDTLIDHKFY